MHWIPHPRKTCSQRHQAVLRGIPIPCPPPLPGSSAALPAERLERLRGAGSKAMIPPTIMAHLFQCHHHCHRQQKGQGGVNRKHRQSTMQHGATGGHPVHSVHAQQAPALCCSSQRMTMSMEVSRGLTVRITWHGAFECLVFRAMPMKYCLIPFYLVSNLAHFPIMYSSYPSLGERHTGMDSCPYSFSQAQVCVYSSVHAALAGLCLNPPHPSCTQAT